MADVTMFTFATQILASVSTQVGCYLGSVILLGTEWVRSPCLLLPDRYWLVLAHKLVVILVV